MDVLMVGAAVQQADPKSLNLASVSKVNDNFYYWVEIKVKKRLRIDSIENLNLVKNDLTNSPR
jgi:hypothetical protein